MNLRNEHWSDVGNYLTCVGQLRKFDPLNVFVTLLILLHLHEV